MRTIKENTYRLYRIEKDEFPENSYILCSEDAADILYAPHMAGKVLQDRMEKVAWQFIDAMDVLKRKKPHDITELVFLAGGLYYQLNQGFKRRFGKALPQCFLGIKRQRVEGSEGEFTAVATYENFESLPKKATVIVGDTIATGATLQKGLYHLFNAVQEKKGTITDLIVCSLACSVNGARLMKEIEKKMHAEFPDSVVHFFVAEELFHLMPDGTDLRFLYGDCVMPEETRSRIAERYGEKLGREMKCAVFDWGTRCKNPIRHYHEFLEYVGAALKTENDKKAKNVLERMKKETEESLKALSNPL